MASTSSKLKLSAKSDAQLKLIYGDDGLTKYWTSSLFNSVYLRHDISEKITDWKNDDSLDFQNFLNSIRNLCIEYKDNEKELSSWSETETINNWVMHVLNALGWSNNCTGSKNPYLEQTSFRYDNKTYRTDILIVDDPEVKKYINQAKGDGKLTEARQSVLLPVEVKYWNRLEEYRQGQKEGAGRVDNGVDDITRAVTPNEQTVQYMEILRKNWGILTDGARWRLFSSELSSEDCERFYEFNLLALYNAICIEETEADSLEILEASKYFYYFFSKSSFESKDGESVVNKVLNYSKKYVNRVEEDLKDRFVKAMNIACNSFHISAKENSTTQDSETIRNISESALFNILFIKSLESRNVLPLVSTDYKKISLSSMIDKIENFDPEKEDLLNVRELERAFKKGNGNSFHYEKCGTELHDRIVRLTDVINKGASKKDQFGFEISGFKESVFSEDEWKLFKTCRLSNHDWVKILFELGYAESESLNRKYQQIPYAYFTARQLGSIYESFLEFKLEKADEDMVYEKKQWKKADLLSKQYKSADLPKVKKNSLFFTPDNSEKKITGSFYTPDFIVQHIVSENLREIVKNKLPKDILNLKACDIAVGSGHFLVGTLKAITKVYLEKLSGNSESIDSITATEAKHKVLSSCIYGVDKNPRAIKLAKLSLWLETASANAKLDDLSNQLKCGDSLIGLNWHVEFKSVFSSTAKSGFDLIVGNPPYSRLQTQSTSDEKLISELKKNYLSARDGSFDLYIPFIEKGLSLLNPAGQLGFILPNTLLTVKYANGIRNLLAQDENVKSIVNFKQFKAFPGVSTYTCILNLSKMPNKEIQYREIKEISLDYNKLVQEGISSDEIFSSEIIAHPSNGEAWELKTEKSNSIFEKIKKISKNDILDQHVNKIFQGFITGRDSIYILKLIKADSKFYYGFSEETNDIVKLEKSICRPVYLGKDVHRYDNRAPENIIIFPYQKNEENEYDLIGFQKLQSQFPLVFDYLKSQRTILEKREKGKFKGNTFYQFSRPQSLKYFDHKKLVMRSFSCQGEIFFDNAGECCFTPNVYGIIPKNSSRDEFYYMMAYLNSNLVWFMIKLTSSGISNGYYQYTTRYTSVLPYLALSESKLRNSVDFKKINEYSMELEKATLEKNQKVVADLQKKIDFLFYKIFDLSDNEIENIESSRYLKPISDENKKSILGNRKKLKKAA